MPDTESRPRLVIVLPEGERDAFDRACRYGGRPKLSMTAAARELFRQFAAGKLSIDRSKAKKAR
jgi:hypothetical protein